MKNRVVSFNHKGLNRLIQQLKSKAPIYSSAFSAHLIGSFQKIVGGYTSFESDQFLQNKRIFFSVYDLKKITAKFQSFLNDRNICLLDEIEKFSTELRSSDMNIASQYYKADYDKNNAKQIRESFNEEAYKGRLRSAYLLFYHMLSNAFDTNSSSHVFTNDLYRRIDEEMSMQDVIDEELLAVLSSFPHLFIDDSYIPFIVTRKSEQILKYIQSLEASTIGTTDKSVYICLLSSLMIKAEKCFTKDKFEEFLSSVLLVSKQMLKDIDFQAAKVIRFDAMLQLCVNVIVLSKRTDAVDSDDILKDVINYLKEKSKLALDNHKDALAKLSSNGVKLTAEDNSVESLYAAVVNKINEIKSNNPNKYKSELYNISNSLEFIIFFNQMLVMNKLKADCLTQAEFVVSPTIIAFTEIIQDAAKVPGSPLLGVTPLMFMSQENIERNLNDTKTLFQLYLYSTNVNEFAENISQMDPSYIGLYNECLSNYLQVSHFDVSRIASLFNLLNINITNQENRAYIIDILSKVACRRNIEEFKLVLGVKFDTLTREDLEAFVAELKATLKNKPNTSLLTITAHLGETEAVAFKDSVWATVIKKIDAIDGELKARKEKAAQEVLRLKEAEAIKIREAEEALRLQKLEAERIDKAEKQLAEFKTLLEGYKPIIDKDIPKEAEIEAFKEAVNALVNTEIEEGLSLEDKVVRLEELIREIKQYSPRLISMKGTVEEIGIVALEVVEKYNALPDEDTQKEAAKMLGIELSEFSFILNTKAQTCEGIANKISEVELTAKDGITKVEQTIQGIKQQIRAERLRKEQEIRKQQEVAAVVEAEEAKAAEVTKTQEIVLKYVKDRMKKIPDGDFITQLDQDLSGLRGGFRLYQVTDKTITLDGYDGPLKEILNRIQTTMAAENRANISFIFNNYRIETSIDRDGVLSIATNSIPEQFKDQKDYLQKLQSILNGIALTLLVPNKTNKGREIQIANSDTEGVTTYRVHEKEAGYRENVFDRIIRHYNNNRYKFSLDGEQIIEDNDFLKDTLLATDYFIQQEKDGVTILIPLFDENDLINAIKKYGASKIVHISLTGHHRRRLTASNENNKSVNSPEVNSTGLVVSDATIRRYIEDRIRYQLSDAERLQYPTVESYLEAFIDNAKNPDGTPLGDVIKKEPYLGFDKGHACDSEHSLEVSFGDGKAETEVGTIRVAYTFVRDSIRLVPIGN